MQAKFFDLRAYVKVTGVGSFDLQLYDCLNVIDLKGKARRTHTIQKISFCTILFYFSAVL